MKDPWIPHPTILNGAHVDLIPLEKSHFEELHGAASDRELWKLIPTDCSEKENFYAAYNLALAEREKGNQYPFAIEKIGGVFEGILRKDKVQSDGTTRNAAYYSILDDEWESAQQKITRLLADSFPEMPV